MRAARNRLGLAPSLGLGARLTLSALAESSHLSPDIEDWLETKRKQPFETTAIPLRELDGWAADPATGNLRHRTGRFFSADGIHVSPRHDSSGEWWQPILVQRDIAILGIIAKEFGGVLHFLLQAKMEPGNADVVQLSPTVQATSSNYTRVHRGNAPPYVEFFTDPRAGRVLVDVLQSEQGAWFDLKRNRNIVVEVTGEVPEHDDFRWLTLGQIHRLLRLPNVINMDARSVLSCLPVTPPGGAPARSATEIMSWFTGRKSTHELTVRPVRLDSLPGWRWDEEAIAPQQGGNFSIVGVRVRADTREVTGWDQPLLAPHGLILAGLVVRRINGTPHALVRAEVQPGHRDTVEIGPTVRFAMSDLDDTPPDRRPEFLDFLLSARDGVLYDVVQSEEGGRFLHAQTRYLIVSADDFPLAVPPDFTWMTVGQLMRLQRHSYHLTIENRSLLFCMNCIS